ncbi:MAG: ester cyclase [Microthrixaceae bacterium]
MADWNELTTRVSDATYEAWNAHDPDAVAAWFTDDARVRDASSSDWEIGPGPVRDRAAMMCVALPDLTLTRQVLVVDGPRHADRWVMAGTHTGELLGVAPTGAQVRFEGATFTMIDEDGMVIEDIHHVDYATLFGQIGVSG